MIDLPQTSVDVSAVAFQQLWHSLRLLQHYQHSLDTLLFLSMSRTEQLLEENKLSVITTPQRVRFHIELKILFCTYIGFFFILSLVTLIHNVKLQLQLRRMQRGIAPRPKVFRNQGGLQSFYQRKLALPAIFGETHIAAKQVCAAIPPLSLPLRLEAIFMAIYIALNITLGMLAYTSWVRPYYTPIFAAKQWGFFAFLNSIFLTMHSGRASPILWLTGMSFSQGMFVHRWLGRLVVLESAVHSIMHFYLYIVQDGYTTTSLILGVIPFVTWGLIAFTAACLILIQAWSPFRKLAYECFHFIHVILAFAFFLGVYLHGALGAFPSTYRWLIHCALLVVCGEHLLRMLKVIAVNLPLGRFYGSSKRLTSATLEAVAGATRVKINIPGISHVRPGQHVFISFPTLAPLQWHPFSIAWHSKQAYRCPDLMEFDDTQNNCILLVVKAKEGFTRTLYKYAKANPNHDLLCLIDGPYGVAHDLVYDEVLVLCGGVGITHGLMTLKHHLDMMSKSKISQRVTLYWVIRTDAEIAWVQEEVDQLLDTSKGSIEIKIYLTRAPQIPSCPPRIPARKLSIESDLSTSTLSDLEKPKSALRSHHIFVGRPKIDSIIKSAITDRIGSLCVTSCGPGKFSDAIRCSVVEHWEHGVTYLEEAFSW